MNGSLKWTWTGSMMMSSVTVALPGITRWISGRSWSWPTQSSSHDASLCSAVVATVVAELSTGSPARAAQGRQWRSIMRYWSLSLDISKEGAKLRIWLLSISSWIIMSDVTASAAQDHLDKTLCIEHARTFRLRKHGKRPLSHPKEPEFLPIYSTVNTYGNVALLGP